MPPGPARLRPNVIVLVADDHRQGALHGDRRTGPATPVLDALAAAGTEFREARITGGNNRAVCVPSRAALMTGCAPHRALAEPWTPVYQRSLRLAPDRALLGETFRRAGYTTHAVGKWHNDRAALARSFQGGAALLFGGMSPHEDPRLYDWDATGAFPPESATARAGFSSEIFADAAIDFLRRQSGDAAPFLLYVAFTSPHDPRTPPAEYRRRYDAASLPLPVNFLPAHPFDNGDLGVRDEDLAGRPRTPAEIRGHLADYYGMIEHHDRQVGRILDALEAGGQRDDTIVVYLSDHGLALGSHGLMGKQNLYEHSLRVPFILRGPGVPAGEAIDTPVYAHRLFPTLCELCALATPDTVDEPGLVREWAAPADAKAPTPRHFAHYYHWQRAVREGRWKLIQYRVHGTFREQVFDVAEDPDERRDLAGRPDVRDYRHRLAAALDEWWENLAAVDSDVAAEPAP